MHLCLAFVSGAAGTASMLPGHLICDLPPKVVAAAMGHSVQTHLGAYSSWCGQEVVDHALANAGKRLGRHG